MGGLLAKSVGKEIRNIRNSSASTTPNAHASGRSRRQKTQTQRRTRDERQGALQTGDEQRQL